MKYAKHVLLQQVAGMGSGRLCNAGIASADAGSDV